MGLGCGVFADASEGPNSRFSSPVLKPEAILLP